MKRTARDVLDSAPLVVESTLTVEELARKMHDTHADAACVVDDGRVVGVVTSMDLIFQKKRLHMPTVIAVLDAVIRLEGNARTTQEIRKMAGATVAQVMTPKPVTVTSNTPLDEVATTMVERHLSILPVVDAGALTGAVTRASMLKALAFE